MSGPRGFNIGEKFTPMSSISLVQFENKDGDTISEVLQVPNMISVDQLRGLVGTTQDLYVNGALILSTLENSLTNDQISDVEQIKKIRLGEDLPATQPALYCSSAYSGHEGPVLVTKFGAGVLVTAGGDKTVRFWDVITKTQFNIVQKHDHWVICLDINERYVVSGGMDKLVNLYDHAGNHVRALARHRDGVSCVKFHGDRIVSVSRDGSCIVWNMDGSVAASWAHAKAIKTLCLKDEYILTGGADQTIKVYKNMKYHCDLRGHAAQVNCIEMHDRYVVSGDDSGAVVIWKDFKLHKRVAHKKEVISLSINPNGMSFASGSFDKTVKLWNLETAETMGGYFHVNLVYKVKVLNDMIFSCSKDKTIRMFKISKKKCVSDLVCEDEIYDFDYHDGHLVCGSKNNKVYFFN